MSFIVENNNITVTNSLGDTVFNTETPMPHITDVITNTITHTFLDSGDSVSYSVFWDPSSYSCPYTYFTYYTETNFSSCYSSSTIFSCCGFMDSSYCSPAYGYEYNFYYGSYEFVQTGQNCFCTTFYSSYDSVTEYEDGHYVTGVNTVSAKDTSDSYNIGQIAANTDPDFLLVLANFSRTSGGGTTDLGTFVCPIHQGASTAANGSTVLESAFNYSSDQWLSRILDVYIDGNTIKADFKHSNKSYTQLDSTSSFNCGPFPISPNVPSSNTSSTFTVDFTIYVGKFTQ
mgnify:CR=1 FL=1